MSLPCSSVDCLSGSKPVQAVQADVMILGMEERSATALMQRRLQHTADVQQVEKSR